MTETSLVNFNTPASVRPRFDIFLSRLSVRHRQRLLRLILHEPGLLM